MNKKAQQAISVVKAGGFIRHQLERNYYGVEKFTWKLVDSFGAVVKGYGFAACNAAIESGNLRRDETVHYGSNCKRVWR